MTTRIPASSVEIVKILFDFIKDHFDEFKHRYEPRNGNQREKWWWINHEYGKDRGERGRSWAPFVEACFVMEGEKTPFTVGHCYNYSHHNVENFIEYAFKVSYNHEKHPCDSSSRGGGGGIDVSWRDNNNYFLALEHSEDSDPYNKSEFCSKFNKGTSNANAQLKGICDEICKLKDKHPAFNIIVSRPNIRDQDHGIYSSVVNEFKKNIEDILSHINPPSNEKWIVILIAPQIHVKDPIKGIMINFHCYEWNGKQLSLITGDRNYSFEVKTVNGFVRKV
ncbi:MAG: hypothetical protein L6282_14850 [Candidatus Methanoperedenaceae archaeon]|nr:hypothetical protein [Candidatus Methanoperedenaceae archaeon]